MVVALVNLRLVLVIEKVKINRGHKKWFFVLLFFKSEVTQTKYDDTIEGGRWLFHCQS